MRKRRNESSVRHGKVFLPEEDENNRNIPPIAILGKKLFFRPVCVYRMSPHTQMRAVKKENAALVLDSETVNSTPGSASSTDTKKAKLSVKQSAKKSMAKEVSRNVFF